MKLLAPISLGILVLGSAALFVMPGYLVSPIRTQSAYDIELSYALSNWAPTLVTINLVIGAILAWAIWRREATRTFGKIVLAAAVVVLAAAAYLASSYPAEGMFTPLPEVVRLPATDATHVLPEDLVLGVKHNGQAAAYPFPIIGYHHIVNDRLAGEPYVVTY